MNRPAGPSVEESIAQFLTFEGPCTYRDACLAFTLRFDPDAVRRTTVSLARTSDLFARDHGECSQCDRHGPMTVIR